MNSYPNFTSVVEGTLNRMVKKFGRKVIDYDALYKELDNSTTSYFTQDDFTVVVMTDELGKMYVGVSKKHADDRKLPLRGRALALSRAIKSLVLSRMVVGSVAAPVEADIPF